MLNFCDFIQVYVFTTNHHLNYILLTVCICEKDSRRFIYIVIHTSISNWFSNDGGEDTETRTNENSGLPR